MNTGVVVGSWFIMMLSLIIEGINCMVLQLKGIKKEGATLHPLIHLIYLQVFHILYIYHLFF